MHNIGSRLDSDLQSRAANLHSNSAALSKQEANLRTATKSLSKDTDKLKKVADDAQRKVKELGNVQNWAEVIEREFLVLEETLRLVNEGDSGSEGSEGEWEPCRICGILGDEETLLLCDGYLGEERCDAPYHMGCIGWKKMPVGDWFCPDCKKGKAGLRRSVSGGVGLAMLGGERADVEMGGMEEQSTTGQDGMDIDGGSSTDAATAPSFTTQEGQMISEDGDSSFKEKSTQSTHSEASSIRYETALQQEDGTWSG
jgi:hypothetical protein